MNEKFFDLPKERQNSIINGALHVFSKYEYKKATMEEIAKSAGVSKSLLFHYFETKKGLYLYLYDYSVEKSFEQMKELKDREENDFFDKIIDAQNLKVKLLLEHPDLMMFLTKVYLEENEEVKSVIKNSFAGLTVQTKVNFFNNIDISKFREDVSPKMVLNIVFWVAEGFMKGRKIDESVDLVSLNDEFVEHLELLKKVFYK